MDEQAIAAHIRTTFPDVQSTSAYGYTFFFYKTDHLVPFATLIGADTEYDRVSNLDRPGVFRLNIGVSRATFQSLFGTAKPDHANWDYTALDVIMPHPDYAAQSFVCVLSPGDATLEQVHVLLAEAYEIAVHRFDRRASGPPN